MLLRRAHHAVVVERRAFRVATRLETRQLGHHEQCDLPRQREGLQVPQHQRGVLVLGRARLRWRHELQVVHDDEPDLA